MTVGAYYHGTSAELEPGDVLEPKKAPPNWDYGDTGNADVVWLHDNDKMAREYGPLVYEVEPLEWVENFSTDSGHELSPDKQEWITPRARVIRRVSDKADSGNR